MHFENMNFKLVVPGKEVAPKKVAGKEFLAPERIRKSEMVAWIKKSGIDEDTKKELLKMLDKYPGNTMHHFYKNIHQHIQAIHKKRFENLKDSDSIKENTSKENSDE